MIDLHDIRYVRLGTGDLAAARKFASEIIGLEVAMESKDRLYLRSDDRDHTLCYFKGDPGDHTVAFEVSSSHDLDAAADALKGRGIESRRGDEVECADRRVMEYLNFKDPTGNNIDLVVRPFHSGKRHFPSRDAGITGFSHVGLRSTDAVRDEEFWTTIFNARVSDWIGPAPLLRIDDIHHKIALFPSTCAGVQHINHQVASIDDIMRSMYLLGNHQIRIVFGPGRHPTSSAIFLYFEGPDGMVFEYSCGVRSIEDETMYQPRQFPFDPTSFCMWGSKPDIPEFKK